MGIDIRHINKTFGNTQVLFDVNLQIASGKITTLLGPSGCGKTTLLRIIAGLEFPDAVPAGAEILFDGVPATDIPVNRRGVGFVFQNYALFRHMTVFENIAFGLRVKPRRERPSRAQIRSRVEELLELIQLSGFGERFPDQLSGGQRQRVALARALAVNPRVLLLDEPFGALDAQVRAELRRWLRRLHEKISVTTVLVTHDQEEALEVSDSLVVVNKGKIEQSGDANEVFGNPANEFVMNFLGEVNVFYGRYEKGYADFRADAGTHSGDDVRMLVRPHDFVVLKTPHNGSDVGGIDTSGAVPAKITRVVPAGALVKIELEDSRRNTLHVHLSHAEFEREPLAVGETVFLRPRASRIFKAAQPCECDYVI